MEATQVAGYVVAGAWAALALLLAVRRRGWAETGSAAIVGVAIAMSAADVRFGVLVPAAAALLLVGAPDGRFASRATRVAAGSVALLTIAATVGLFASSARAAIVVAAATLFAIVGGSFAGMRARRAPAIDAARLQWLGWGAVMAGALALTTLALHGLLDWPDPIAVPVAIESLFVPAALAFAAFEATTLRIDRLLVHTMQSGGLVVTVGAVYVLVVLGFGNAPTDESRRVLGLSLIAAAVAAACFAPTRRRLEEFANRRVYGGTRAPDEPLQTFGARMSRAIPLDELLLQLAESLKKSMQLANAEVWTGSDGVYERAASVPYRESERVKLGDEEIGVVARAHAQGNAWMQVWLPALLDELPGKVARVAPLVHSGELLGFILCARTPDQPGFSDEDDRVLTELSRQVGLALHNSALDTALQASLDDLRIANEELRASRSRIVAAADQSRRQIERNLHDGAQQHLVALAVKLGLARQLVEGDPQTAATLLEELRADAQTTLTELRELAHGIYPPLLMDRGLGEALRAAANRAVLPTDVDADVGRYPSEAEAAVYFCCLEALQNAGKHAGESARIMITVAADDTTLRFSVVDDGAGFDADGTAVRGHGFVNMEDRLGAIGGRVVVDSAPGRGTRILGEIPLEGIESA